MSKKSNDLGTYSSIHKTTQVRSLTPGKKQDFTSSPCMSILPKKKEKKKSKTDVWDAQILGGKPTGRINFVRWSLIFAGPRCGTDLTILAARVLR